MKEFLLTFLISFVLTSHVFGAELEALIKKAERNDYKLKSLLYKVKAGKYRVDQAKAQYHPQITFTTYYGWQEYKPYYSSEIRQVLKYYFLSLKQPVYHPEILAKIKQTKLYMEVDSLQASQEREYIRYLLITNLLYLSYSYKKEELYRNLIDVERARLALGKELFKKKLLTADSLIDIEKSYEDARYGFRNAVLESGAALNNLELLLGNWEGEKPILKLNVPIDVLANYGGRLKSEIRKNSEVRIAEKNVEIADSELSIRKYERYPKVDLSLSYSYTSSSAISVASRDKRAAITIEIPIYGGGYYSARRLEAEELKKSAEADKISVLKEKEKQFEDSYSRLREAAEKQRYLQLKLQKDKELLKITQEGVESKVKTVFDLLEKKENILNDKLQILKEVHKGLDAFVELLYVTANLDLPHLKVVESSIHWVRGN